MIAMRRRSVRKGTSWIGTPSITTRPPAASFTRIKATVIVLFPAPVRPMIAVLFDAGTFIDSSLSTRGPF